LGRLRPYSQTLDLSENIFRKKHTTLLPVSDKKSFIALLSGVSINTDLSAKQAKVFVLDMLFHANISFASKASLPEWSTLVLLCMSRLPHICLG
jgi:hypothetical protein